MSVSAHVIHAENVSSLAGSAWHSYDDVADGTNWNADLLSLKICMSHHTQRGHLNMMGRYIMQQANRSAGNRCCRQCDSCGHRRACPTMLLCHCCIL